MTWPEFLNPKQRWLAVGFQKRKPTFIQNSTETNTSLPLSTHVAEAIHSRYQCPLGSPHHYRMFKLKDLPKKKVWLSLGPKSFSSLGLCFLDFTRQFRGKMVPFMKKKRQVGVTVYVPSNSWLNPKDPGQSCCDVWCSGAAREILDEERQGSKSHSPGHVATSSPQEPKTLQTIPKMFRDWVHLVTSTWQPLPFAKAPTTKTTMNPSKVDGNGGESYHKRPVGLKQTCPRLFSLASLQLLTLRDENFPIKKTL